MVPVKKTMPDDQQLLRRHANESSEAVSAPRFPAARLIRTGDQRLQASRSERSGADYQRSPKLEALGERVSDPGGDSHWGLWFQQHCSP